MPMETALPIQQKIIEEKERTQADGRVGKGISTQASHRNVREGSLHTALVISSTSYSNLPVIKQIGNLTLRQRGVE